jgi:hypothetical protein
MARASQDCDSTFTGSLDVMCNLPARAVSIGMRARRFPQAVTGLPF